MSDVKRRVQALLQDLSTEERQLLNRVLRLEHEHLHQQKPRLKEDLMRVAREIIK